MNQLTLHNYGFLLVPKIMEKAFLQNLQIWYESTAEVMITPTLFENMFYQEDCARDCLLWLIDDIGTFEFVKHHIGGITEEDFEDARSYIPDEKYDENVDFYIEAYDSYLESAFVTDIKKWLHKNHLFYANDYKRMDKFYVNNPVGEVW